MQLVLTISVLCILVVSTVSAQSERSERERPRNRPRRTTTTTTTTTTPAAPTLGNPCTDGSQCARRTECCLQPNTTATPTCQARRTTAQYCDQRMFWPDGDVIPGVVTYEWCPCVMGEFCPPDRFGEPPQPPYRSICSFG